MPVSQSRRSRRSGGGWLGKLSPAPVGGRRSRRSRRNRRGGGTLSPSTISDSSKSSMKAGYRGGSLPQLTPAVLSEDSPVGFNGLTLPVGAGSPALSGGRRSRKSRKSRRSRR